jgi:glycosyltransferase involved in cell wall biosynthesis
MAAPSDQPLVTVVICVYTAGAYLRPSVDSIINQSYTNLEILIIDDGSTDGCMRTIADHANDDRRVRVLSQSNAGKPVALNRALDEMCGEYFAIHDADDLSCPTRIERQQRALRANPELGAVFAGYELLMGQRAIAPTCAPRSIEQCRADVDVFRMPAHDATVMFRTDCTRGLRYEPALTLGEGRDFILQVGERYPLEVIGECLYAYRIHSDAITVRQQRRRADFDAQVISRACARRGMPTPEMSTAVTETNDKQHSLVSHFMQSVVDQRERGDGWDALRTAMHCVNLRPLSPYYYRPLAYALLPLGLIRRYRRRRATTDGAGFKATQQRKVPKQCPTSR